MEWYFFLLVLLSKGKNAWNSITSMFELVGYNRAIAHLKENMLFVSQGGRYEHTHTHT